MPLPSILYNKEVNTGHLKQFCTLCTVYLLLMVMPFTVPSPLTDTFSCLQEASVVCLLEGLVGLRDEGGGPLDALFAAGYLLG